MLTAVSEMLQRFGRDGAVSSVLAQIRQAVRHICAPRAATATADELKLLGQAVAAVAGRGTVPQLAAMERDDSARLSDDTAVAVTIHPAVALKALKAQTKLAAREAHLHEHHRKLLLESLADFTWLRSAQYCLRIFILYGTRLTKF